jgi:hypothetical protein
MSGGAGSLQPGYADWPRSLEGEGAVSIRPDFLVVGHVARDVVDEGYYLGGTASYASLTARNLGWNAGIVTSASADLDLDRALPQIQIDRKPSRNSTTFRNIYTDGRRCQVLHEVADGIEDGDVPVAWRDAPIVLLAPLAHELEENMVDLFPRSMVALAPQGWLRQWDDRGRVSPRTWPAAGRLPSRPHVLIFSLEDVGGDLKRAEALASLTTVAVLTRGAEGATLFQGGESIHYPAVPVREEDPTGAGDVFAAAFLIRWTETDAAGEAVRFANCAAGLSVAGRGLAGIPIRDQVNSYMERQGIVSGDELR